eukprot:6591501-Prymnesium_polylepis.1
MHQRKDALEQRPEHARERLEAHLPVVPQQLNARREERAQGVVGGALGRQLLGVREQRLERAEAEDRSTPRPTGPKSRQSPAAAAAARSLSGRRCTSSSALTSVSSDAPCAAPRSVTATVVSPSGGARATTSWISQAASAVGSSVSSALTSRWQQASPESAGSCAATSSAAHVHSSRAEHASPVVSSAPPPTAAVGGAALSQSGGVEVPRLAASASAAATASVDARPACGAGGVAPASEARARRGRSRWMDGWPSARSAARSAASRAQRDGCRLRRMSSPSLLSSCTVAHRRSGSSAASVASACTRCVSSRASSIDRANSAKSAGAAERNSPRATGTSSHNSSQPGMLPSRSRPAGATPPSKRLRRPSKACRCTAIAARTRSSAVGVILQKVATAAFNCVWNE